MDGSLVMPITARPLQSNCLENLAAEEIFKLFNHAAEYEDKFSVVAPVRPITGQIFLFHLGEDESQWEKRKKQLRYIAIYMNKKHLYN